MSDMNHQELTATISSTQPQPSVVVNFRLKKISFFHRDVVIICQNENGPCPLIAISNILILQGKIIISPDRSFISLDEIIAEVANEIMERKDQYFATNHNRAYATHTEGGASSLSDLNFHQQLEDVFNILPTLAKGLDLNICFHGINKYEFTNEITIFDILQIPLYHGWLYPDNKDEHIEVISNKSYNHLVYKLVDYKSLLDKLSEFEISHPDECSNIGRIEILEKHFTADEKELFRQGRIIDSFLNETSSQLTTKGLLSLYEHMKDRQLAVFFRNNHFTTMFSYNAQLFLLLTDEGFAEQSSIIWEKLESVDG
jgi:hypothetical protein